MILDLVTRFLNACDIWIAAHDSGFTRLGAAVGVNDSKLFGRLREGASVTTATLQKFSDFFATPENWTSGVVDEEVATFVAIIGISHSAAVASPDNAPDIIGGGNIGSAGLSAISRSPGGEAPGRASAVLRHAHDQSDRALAGAAGVGLAGDEPTGGVEAGEAAAVEEAA